MTAIELTDDEILELLERRLKRRDHIVWNAALERAADLFDDDIDYTADEIRERLASLRRRS